MWHDEVTTWKCFQHYWDSIVTGGFPSHRGSEAEFDASFLLAWTKCWINSWVIDMRCHDAYKYDIIVMRYLYRYLRIVSLTFRSPKCSLEMCVLQKSYLWEFQAETLYVCPKLLGTCTKFQPEIPTINVISGIEYFREIIFESSRNVTETTPGFLTIPSYRSSKTESPAMPETL